ncbi:LysM peptidoglycan-binding domain-containing protein, partial [Aquabacterium sp.]|uniref:LysM peptidoglycan-binding domain-containing protein n=1 Tax=Aquabacterium sp. TaxID=1872578 RepID=UPI003B6BD281
MALGLSGTARAEFPNYPITAQQKATAQQVAQAGVPLSELAPNAPDSYTVKRGDTLWAISSLFLKSPWRWPELWGMNLQQIRNPHLIFPGQYLYLDKSNGRARLRVGEPVGGGVNGTTKLSPRVREGSLYDAIATVPLHLLEPYFNEAVIFDNSEELLQAPRVVATQEGRVLLSRGETAYVRGELGGRREWRLFRTTKPLRDPSTQEVLGFEAQYVGTEIGRAS